MIGRSKIAAGPSGTCVVAALVGTMPVGVKLTTSGCGVAWFMERVLESAGEWFDTTFPRSNGVDRDVVAGEPACRPAFQPFPYLEMA